MYTAIFVKIGMHIVKEDWHTNSEGREQEGGGRYRKRDGKVGERDRERRDGKSDGNSDRFSADKWQNTANISIDTFLLSLS